MQCMNGKCSATRETYDDWSALRLHSAKGHEAVVLLEYNMLDTPQLPANSATQGLSPHPENLISRFSFKALRIPS